MKTIQWKDIVLVAAHLRTDPAAVAAVLAVECNWPQRGGFSRGRLRVLWERHKCWKHASPRERKRLPRTICNPQAGGYARTTKANWERLAAAKKVMGDRAYLAASYGLPQILGENHKVAGYSSARLMVTSFYTGGEPEQLWAMARFIEASPGLLRAIRRHDWARFARLYNGKNYRKNNYDRRLARSWARFRNRHFGADEVPRRERTHVPRTSSPGGVSPESQPRPRAKAERGVAAIAFFVTAAIVAAASFAERVWTWVTGLF